MSVRCRKLLSALRSPAVTVIGATVLSLAATSAVAQDTTGVGAISGVVVSTTGLPATGVRVGGRSTCLPEYRT